VHARNRCLLAKTGSETLIVILRAVVVRQIGAQAGQTSAAGLATHVRVEQSQEQAQTLRRRIE
jgi:hypothetical protein